MGGDLHFGIVSWVSRLAWMNLFLDMWAAVSDRSEPFLAFVVKFFSAAAVDVVGLNIEMYASMSACDGGSLWFLVSRRLVFFYSALCPCVCRANV